MTAAETNPENVLRSEIIADARRQAERLARRARTDAEALLAKARAEAEQARRERARAAQAEAARRRNLALATVPVQAARMRAERTEAALQAVHDEAGERLAAREGLDARRAIVDLAAEAVSAMAGNRFVLEMSEADRRAFGDAAAEEVRGRLGRPDVVITVAPGSDRVAAGVVVRDDAGRQVWDNSLAARLERLWPAMRSQVAALLPRRSEAKPGALARPEGAAGKEP